MNKTKIEWTDATWNPIRGCSRVSEGCRNCYAEKVAYRFSGPGKPYEGLVRINAKGERVPEWNGQVHFIEKHLLDPLKWGPAVQHTPDCERFAETREAFKMECKCPSRPRRIFVNSMSDLFHENVPDEWIDRIFAVMALCPQHQFQVLTKRPQRMSEYIEKNRRSTQTSTGAAFAKAILVTLDAWGGATRALPSGFRWPLPNVWLGVSVENQETADKRIPLLLQTPAAVRFISAEPLLGPVGLTKINTRQHMRDSFQKMVERAEDSNSVNLPILRNCLNAIPESDLPEGENPSLNALTGEWFDGWDSGDDDQKLDWVIVGGESGPRARPMHQDWARSLRDQCQATGVPFFFKQWGEWAPNWLNDDNGKIPGSEWMDKMGKKMAAALLDGREWHEFPEVSA